MYIKLKLWFSSYRILKGVLDFVSIDIGFSKVLSINSLPNTLFNVIFSFYDLTKYLYLNLELVFTLYILNIYVIIYIYSIIIIYCLFFHL